MRVSEAPFREAMVVEFFDTRKKGGEECKHEGVVQIRDVATNEIFNILESDLIMNFGNRKVCGYFNEVRNKYERRISCKNLNQ